MVPRRGGGHAVGGGHAGGYPALLVRLDVADPVAHAGAGSSTPASTPRFSIAPGARSAPGWLRRLPSCCGPPAPLPRRVASSRCATCTSGWETAESWRSSSISTRTGCAGTGSSIGPRSFAAGLPEGYRPGEPNREEWPYDPFPLVVETRPRPVNPSMAVKESRGDGAGTATR